MCDGFQKITSHRVPGLHTDWHSHVKQPTHQPTHQTQTRHCALDWLLHSPDLPRLWASVRAAPRRAHSHSLSKWPSALQSQGYPPPVDQGVVYQTPSIALELYPAHICWVLSSVKCHLSSDSILVFKLSATPALTDAAVAASRERALESGLGLYCLVIVSSTHSARFRRWGPANDNSSIGYRKGTAEQLLDTHRQGVRHTQWPLPSQTSQILAWFRPADSTSHPGPASLWL